VDSINYIKYDIYSAGCLFYEMVMNMSVFEWMQANEYNETTLPTLPTPLDKIILPMLRKDPQKRISVTKALETINKIYY
jgi:hypothetical protein